MPEYKLYYFGVYARGEAARMLLAHSKADYEFVSFGMEDWPKYKPEMAGGVVPCLELADGQKLGQSAAICRFLAMKLGYYPADPLEAYQNDMIVDTYMDVISKIYLPAFCPPDKREENITLIFEQVLPKFLKFIEPIAAKGTKFITGDKLALADFWVGGLYVNYFVNKAVGYAPEKFAELIKEYPAFEAYGKRFEAEMSEYLAQRPPAPV